MVAEVWQLSRAFFVGDMDVANGEERQKRRGQWISNRWLNLSGLHIGANERDAGPFPIPFTVVVWPVFRDLTGPKSLLAMWLGVDRLIERRVDMCRDRVRWHLLPVHCLPDPILHCEGQEYQKCQGSNSFQVFASFQVKRLNLYCQLLETGHSAMVTSLSPVSGGRTAHSFPKCAGTESVSYVIHITIILVRHYHHS